MSHNSMSSYVPPLPQGAGTTVTMEAMSELLNSKLVPLHTAFDGLSSEMSTFKQQVTHDLQDVKHRIDEVETWKRTIDQQMINKADMDKAAQNSVEALRSELKKQLY